jgi:acylphosphatase
MTVAKRCVISGRVQGVFYRASTQVRARELGVHGYAKNLADGRVEVLLVGAQASVDALVAWLWQGSPTSQVTGVEVVELLLTDIDQLPTGFAAR